MSAERRLQALNAGVTFDAFKGWAKSKQRKYLDDHPESTFFDRLGITDRDKRNTKKLKKQHRRLEKQSKKDLKDDPTLRKDIENRLDESQESVDKAQKKVDSKLGFRKRRQKLKEIRKKQKELLKMISSSKRKLLIVVSKKRRNTIKNYIQKLKDRILLLQKTYDSLKEKD